LNIKQQLEKRYVYSSKNIDALETAFQLNKNIVLFGPPGESKSTLSVDYLKLKGVTSPYIMSLGMGSKTEDLFGTINIEEFTKNNKVIYNVEESFMAHEYVIFEEAFDAPAELLAQLKDILSSGWFRKGNQQYKIKTKLVIVCTNVDRKQYSKNPSIKALMERFPLEKKFEWEKYNAVTYGNLIRTVKGDEYANPLLLTILEEFAKKDNKISPRIALEASELLYHCGIDCLDLIADFNSDPELLKNAKITFAFDLKFNTLASEITDLFNKFKLIESDENKSTDMITYKGQIEYKLKEIEAIPTPDDKTQLKASVVKNAKDYIRIIDKTVTTLNDFSTFDSQEGEDLFN